MIRTGLFSVWITTYSTQRCTNSSVFLLPSGGFELIVHFLNCSLKQHLKLVLRGFDALLFEHGGGNSHCAGKFLVSVNVLIHLFNCGVRIPAGSPKRENPQSKRIAGFSLFFNASWSFRYFKILKRISIKRKQKQNFASKFACSFACCLLAIKKPLGSLRAALFISPMIFSLCPFRQQFRDTAFSARQTSQELRGALFRERFPFLSLRLYRRRNR